MRWFLFISMMWLSSVGFSQNNNIAVEHNVPRPVDISNTLAVKKSYGVIIRPLALTPETKTIRFRCSSSLSVDSSSILYIVDGVRENNIERINVDSFADVTLLQGAAAAAIFGPDGRNGAMVITTKKANFNKTKTLDTVKINSGIVCRKTKCIRCCGNRLIRDTIKSSQLIQPQSIDHSLLKIYPSPVKKGNPFNVEFKMQENGVNIIQIMDAAGRIVMQRQTIVKAKNYKEEIPTGADWSSGIYYIKLFDADKKMISSSNFLIQ